MYNMYDIIITSVLALFGLIFLVRFMWKEHVEWRKSTLHWKDLEDEYRSSVERRLQQEENTPPNDG